MTSAITTSVCGGNRRLHAWSAAVLAVCCAAASEPPKAPIHEVADNYFGREIRDPYRYMEGGTPEAIEWLQAQRQYSGRLPAGLPERVKDRVPYPAVLLSTGMNDPVVDPWQSAKMAARLQAATASGRPVLLRVDDGGHDQWGATKSQLYALRADQLAFLIWQLRQRM